ncbi:hypothetical protein [Chryseobacterium koreense]|uniref:hypothetical protein n=1 Tax=Chryseobacterium koreense TaxID=232216 RepID=UPI0026F07B23|nr:hypothetical protein [Chryseobacterium koreense]
MKKLLLILPLVLLFFVQCGKRDDELANDLYVGTWNWKTTNGGLGNIIETPESTGIVKKLKLTETYQYSITENDVVTKEGTYSLQKGVTSTDHMEKTYMVFSNNGEKIVMQIDATNLVLADDNVDGFTYHYQK